MAYPNDQGDPAGAIPVYNAPSAAGGSSFANLAVVGSSQVKVGAGQLVGVVVNSGGTGTDTLSLYDGTSAAGTPIAVINTSNSISLAYGLRFSTGLFAVVAGTTAANITVIFA